ncbi:MAG: ABC transporter ATP-binding protein [Propionibacteriaceae bacterium]|jgi:iron complex transport system ATP-binding protein|nr:ABC transporter ATP-binding protein [Propionibacteriaceae bacterium]
MSEVMLGLDGVSVRYGSHVVVDDASFELTSGDWLMVVGPNGAGKSTLINAITGAARYDGVIRCLGHDVRTYSPARLARIVGVLAQNHSVGYAFTVGEVVNMGRYAHTRSMFSDRTNADEQAIKRAITLTGLEPLLDQSVLTLSGGELQRTFLAQLFAQDPQILLLDEPTNHLDLVYQEQVFDLIREWLKTPGRAVLSVVHDLSLAKSYGSRAVLMKAGRIVADGTVLQALSEANLAEVYGMDVFAWMRKMLQQWEAT